MKYFSFSFHVAGEAEKEILLAHLDAIGFTGFEEKENELIAFIPADRFDQVILDEMIEALPIATPLNFQKDLIDEENWNERWEKQFRPVFIDHEVYIRASFHSQNPGALYEIVIDPKMSFGTGHHETTEMMIRLMLRENFKNKKVLDFGCGTAVLSILASKLGAASVTAIDNDHWAVENAKENIYVNGISNLEIYLDDKISPPDASFDIVLANITREVIMKQLPHFSSAMKPGGLLFVSGFLQEDEKLILEKSGQASFQFKTTKVLGKWMANVFGRT